MSGDPWAPLRPGLRALSPFLADLIVVGGWAFRLYELHPWAGDTAIDPIMTFDADLLFAREAKGDAGRALLDAGFVVARDGATTNPPVEKYRISVGGDELEIEFLQHRSGGEQKRKGRDVTATVANVTAVRLPHLDILAESTWEVTVPSSGQEAGELVVRVPNPAAFILHKLIVLPERARKRANDVRYIHDVLVRFAARLDDLAPMASASVVTPKRLRKVRAVVESLIDDRDVLDDAARMTSRAEPVDTFTARLRAGLDRVIPPLSSGRSR